MENIRALDYEDKVSHAQYRHLEAHGKGRKKYYYTISGVSQGVQPDDLNLSNVFMTMKTG